MKKISIRNILFILAISIVSITNTIEAMYKYLKIDAIPHPLHSAVKQENVDRIKKLIKKGTQIDVTNQQGETALHHAISMNLIDIARQLIVLGANCNVQDNNGNTPLYIAIKEKYEPLVSLLLYHGANTTIKNKSGKTALELAIENPHSKIFTLLIDNGGDILIKNPQGKSLLDIAISKMATHLQKKGGINAVGDIEDLREIYHLENIIRALIENGLEMKNVDETIINEGLKNVLGNKPTLWMAEREKSIGQAEEHLKKFEELYNTEHPSLAFYHITQAFKALELKVTLDIAYLDNNPESKENKSFESDAHLAFIPEPSEHSLRPLIDNILKEISDKTLSTQEINLQIKSYAKLFPYHYKIHIMPRAKKHGTSMYLADPLDATKIILQLIKLFFYNRTFRSNIETFKVMREPIIWVQEGKVIPFIVIYPRLLPGAAEKVARILDQNMTFIKTDQTFPIRPIPRFNLKFNHDDKKSGIFYAMGNADYKDKRYHDCSIFDADGVLFNNRVKQLTNYKKSFTIHPDKKRKRSSTFTKPEDKKLKQIKKTKK